METNRHSAGRLRMTRSYSIYRMLLGAGGGGGGVSLDRWRSTALLAYAASYDVARARGSASVVTGSQGAQ
jgi:hypothetical protein